MPCPHSLLMMGQNTGILPMTKKNITVEVVESIEGELFKSIRAILAKALPAEQKEERVFVLPLDGNGLVLAKPIRVSAGHEDGTTQIDVGAADYVAFGNRSIGRMEEG